MSSPDGGRGERNLTIIVVPHDELEARNFVISYGKLKALVAASVLLLLAFAVTLAVLFPIVIQASKASRLEAELAELEGDRARVAELARTLQAVEAQYEKVRQLLGADATINGDSAPILPPLRRDSGGAPDNEEGGASGSVSLWPLSTPGYVTRTLIAGGADHPGLDIAVPRNSYIRAAGAGSVRAAGVDDIYGHYVVLTHGDGLETVYGHASRILVTAGATVARGDIIGFTGSTGRSTAPHLHFEVRRNGKPVDPLTFVRQP